MSKKVINIPTSELDMFAKYGVKTIVAGNTEFKIHKTRRKRCKHCGQLKPKEQVNYVVNPYEEEINGKNIKQKLCDDCYKLLIDEC